MTIGIDASRANLKEKTGVEWYAFEIIQEFKKIIPSDTRVVLYSRKPLRGALGNLPANWSSRVLTMSGDRFWTLLRLSYEMIKDKPDVLFVPSHTLPYFAPKKSFTTIHDIGFVNNPDLYSSTQGRYQLFSLKRNLKSSRKIFVPSNFTKTELLNYFKIDPSKISVINLGLNNAFLKPGSIVENNLALKELEVSKPYFLYVGRLEQKKNIFALIKAFNIFLKKTNLQFNLVLVGQPGFRWLEAKNYIFKNKLNNKVQTANWVPTKFLVELYRGAQAVIYPSNYEGFGLVLLEAFSSGVPIVASQNGSIPEIGQEAVYYVKPTNPDEIARGLIEVTTDLNLRQKLIAAGNKIFKNFSWQQCARQTLSQILK